MHGEAPYFVYNKASMSKYIQIQKMDKIPWFWPRLQITIHGLETSCLRLFKLCFLVSSHLIYKYKTLASQMGAHTGWKNSAKLKKKNIKVVKFEFQFPALLNPNKGSKHTPGGPLKHLQPLLSFETLPNASTNPHGLYFFSNSLCFIHVT